MTSTTPADPNTPLPLNTGRTIPFLGYGTWQAPPGQTKTSVLHALRSGYRHIDCAYMYGNEGEVGEALAQAISEGICTRADLFITTKLWCTYHSRVEECLDQSLHRLGLDHVDLYLMHWPVPMNPHGSHPLIPKHPDGSRDLDTAWPYTKTWSELERVYETTSKAKAIGVANHSVPFLEKLVQGAQVVPAVNQIENHPYLPQDEIVRFCRDKGIHVTAYSPLGSTGSPLMKEDAVKSVAARRGVSEGCVLLSYHLARHSSVLTKSITPSRIESNMALITLSDQDMRDLDGISSVHPPRRYVYPAFGVDLGFPKDSVPAAA